LLTLVEVRNPPETVDARRQKSRRMAPFKSTDGFRLEGDLAKV
jgi:hypothetical protein